MRAALRPTGPFTRSSAGSERRCLTRQQRKRLTACYLLPATYTGGVVYTACRRSGVDGELPYPHHGQWGTTPPLTMCGAVMRAHAAQVKD